MTELPLAGSGGWPDGEADRMRAALASADARLSGRRTLRRPAAKAAATAPTTARPTPLQRCQSVVPATNA